MKHISLTEFREAGYLQEVNRQFFHPLGLAFSVTIDAITKEVRFDGILDHRDDPEGVIFSETEVTKPEFIDNSLNIDHEQVKYAMARRKGLGFIIQPVDPTKESEDATLRD